MGEAGGLLPRGGSSVGVCKKWDTRDRRRNQSKGLVSMGGWIGGKLDRERERLRRLIIFEREARQFTIKKIKFMFGNEKQNYL